MYFFLNVLFCQHFQVAVNALLGESSQLVEYGTALMANLATKEVKAVVCILIHSSLDFHSSHFHFHLCFVIHFHLSNTLTFSIYDQQCQESEESFDCPTPSTIPSFSPQLSLLTTTIALWGS